MLKVVCDGSVSKCFKKGLDSSDSLEIRFIEEPTSHRPRNIEKHSDSFFGFSSYYWFEVCLVDSFFHIFTLNISRHQVKVDCFFFAGKNIVDVVWLGNIFIFAHEYSKFSLFISEQQIAR